MIVKPAHKGQIIRDPKTGIPVPETGLKVTEDSFWRRRVKDGDVILADEKASAVSAGDSDESDGKKKKGDNK